MAVRERISILASKDVKLKDSVKLWFGDGASAAGLTGDVSLTWNGSSFVWGQLTANSSMAWGADGAGIDQVWYGDTASVNVTWDQSADSLIFTDNAKLALGSSSDIVFNWDNTSLKITQATVNSAIQFGVSGAGIDILWFGDTAGYNLTWDQSADSLIFGDNAKLALGDSSDIVFLWNNTDLLVSQATVNSAIKWGVDGAGIDHVFYGDTASATMTWDQSADTLIMAGVAKFGSHKRVVTVGTPGAVAATDSGNILVANAAGTYTLPALVAGYVFEFFQASANSLIITSPGDNMIVKNDTCTTVTFGTGGEQIGASVRVFCDGTNYFMQDLSPEAYTFTLS